jgi:putative ABC transport system permease protein
LIVLWTFTIREISRHPGRWLLTLLGVALSLATVVSCRLTSATIHASYRDLFAQASGPFTLEVTAPGLAPFDPSVAHALEGVEGVRAIRPRVQGAVAVVGHSGGVTAALLGVDRADGEFQHLRSGKILNAPGEALIEASLADGLGVQPGQRLRVWSPEGDAELLLEGILESRRSFGAGGPLLVVPLGTAQRLLALEDQINSLCIELADGVEAGRVRAALQKRLPAGVATHPPGAQAELAHATLRTAEQGLETLCFLALSAAVLVTLNTILLNLETRRKQIAVLKTLGATRRQVFGLLIRESALLGVGAALLGSVMGLAFAWGLLAAMGQFLGVAMPALSCRFEPFLIVVVLGPTTTVVATCLPAWYGCRRSALDELRPRQSDREVSVSLRIGRVGIGLILLGLFPATAILQGCRGAVGEWLLGPTLALLLGGGVLASPLLVGAVLSRLSAVPLCLEYELAARQLARNAARTGLTAGVLFLAVAVAVGFGHSLRGILHDLHQWFHQTIVADFLVRGSLPDSAFVLASALPESLGAEIERIEGVDRVERISFLPGQAQGEDVLILARTFASSVVPLDLREGDSGTVRARLLTGEAVLSASLAGRWGVHPGDTFTLTTGQGPLRLRIAGTANEFAAGGSALYLDWETARKVVHLPGVHVFLVSARPSMAARVGTALRRFCRGRQLQLQSNADLRDLIDDSLGRLTGAIWAFLALLFLVAALGVANAMLMNLEEQKHAFALLRLLGLKGWQIGRMVAVQALLLAVLAVPVGLFAGLGLAYLLSRASASWAGMPISFRVEPDVLAGCGLLATGCALLAAALQARRVVGDTFFRGLREG